MIDPIPAKPDSLEFPDVPYTPEIGSIQSSITSRALANVTGTLPVAGACQLPGITGRVVSAIIFLEPAETAVAGAILARYWQDGTHPDSEKGFPVKAGETFEIKGFANVTNLRVASADGLAHILQIQFFS